MLKDKDLAYNPSEYLAKFPKEKRKAIAVITEQQMIFASVTESDDERIHYDLVQDIHRAVNPSIPFYLYEEGFPSSVYIFIDTKGVLITEPLDGKVSELQLGFIIDFLKEISDYNRIADEKVPIKISIHGEVYDNIYSIDDIKDELITKFLTDTRKEVVIEDEKFIGKLYPDEDIQTGIRL